LNYIYDIYGIGNLAYLSRLSSISLQHLPLVSIYVYLLYNDQCVCVSTTGPQSTYRDGVEIRGCVSAVSAGAYTTTLYVMVIKVKGVGRAPPTLTSLGCFFTLMTECTPVSGHCHSVYSVVLSSYHSYMITWMVQRYRLVKNVNYRPAVKKYRRAEVVCLGPLQYISIRILLG
jgi:hypothetical protein